METPAKFTHSQQRHVRRMRDLPQSRVESHQPLSQLSECSLMTPILIGMRVETAKIHVQNRWTNAASKQPQGHRHLWPQASFGELHV